MDTPRGTPAAEIRNWPIYERLVTALLAGAPDDGMGNLDLVKTIEDTAFLLLYSYTTISLHVRDVGPLLLKPAFEKSIQPTEEVPGLALAFALRLVAQEHSHEQWIIDQPFDIMKFLTDVEKQLPYLFR